MWLLKLLEYSEQELIASSQAEFLVTVHLKAAFQFLSY